MFHPLRGCRIDRAMKLATGQLAINQPQPLRKICTADGGNHASCHLRCRDDFIRHDVPLAG